MKIYVMGNILVREDALPVNLLPILRKEFPQIEFIELDPTEDIIPEKKSLTIIDTVINTKEVCLIHDIDRIELGRIVSLHDFDLGYNLKLMKKFGVLEKVNIIGVPPAMDEIAALKEIKKVIASLSSESV
jgi:hypothetical protein